MVVMFIDDDRGYLQWVVANPTGFVVNCDVKPRPGYLKLHRTACRTVTGTPANGQRWTDLYAKVCSLAVRDLQTWANRQVGGRLNPCRRCNP